MNFNSIKKALFVAGLTFLNRTLLSSAENKGSSIHAEHVIWGYRLFLDREPESPSVIPVWLNYYGTTGALRREMMASMEFRQKNADLASMIAYSRETHIVIKELEDKVRLFVNLSDYFIGQAIIKGNYEQDEIEFVRKYVKIGQNVLDIGANIGYFAMIMASIVGPTGKVYAFEPMDSLTDLLERSVAENGFQDSVVVERSAVSQTKSSIDIVFEEVGINTGGSYLDTAGVGPPDGLTTRRVDTVALDDYGLSRPVSFIKIDVEGAELLALRGAKTILQEDRPVIMSEIHSSQLERVSGCTPEEYLAEIEGYGYTSHILEGDSLVPLTRELQSEAISTIVFLPKNRED